jgi:hypothetical protein
MPKSIGVVFASIETNVQDILAFLTTYQNTLQGTFEFRLLSCPDEDDFVDLLSRPEPPTHAQAAAEMPGFVSRIKAAQVAEASDYGLSNELIDKVVVLTGIRFSDNYYYVGNPKWAIIALGGWHRDFSPPSIVEYYLSILVTSALDALGANIDRHYNTRGCIFDFNAALSDKRLSVLSGHICPKCAARIEAHSGTDTLADALILLKRSWLGTPGAPSEVATTVKKLGYDLFHTTGVKPSLKERLLSALEQEGLKNFLSITSQLLVAAALVIIGLKR